MKSHSDVQRNSNYPRGISERWPGDVARRSWERLAFQMGITRRVNGTLTNKIFHDCKHLFMIYTNFQGFDTDISTGQTILNFMTIYY
ncbi:hypothetical protein HAX54_036045 [Datura stramonium]|uniref:Uncharacterized protein n=1 Tax=Datura stramonium TaxID=4076 RepID=A0ABS8SFW7_DATST|nr:hypothetical protein [Datura stramonium]